MANSTQAQLQTLITSTLLDNTSGAITPAILRAALNAILLSSTSSLANSVIYFDASGIPTYATLPSLGVFSGDVSPQGRLTLTSGTAVPISDVAAATIVYYTPAVGQIVPIYNGTAFINIDIGGELSQSTTDNTKSPAAVVNNSNYDIFIWNDSNTIRSTRGPAWTSATNRGTGAGTTELLFLKGVAVNKFAITNGPGANLGTYVGTIRSNGTATIDLTFGSSATGGGAAIIGVWNLYNQVPVSSIVKDTTASWTYQSATIRSANNSVGNRFSFVHGLQLDPIKVEYNAVVNYSGGAASSAQIGFVMDADNSYDFSSRFVSVSAAIAAGLHASGAYKPVLGFHFIQATESTDVTNNNQFVAGGITQSLVSISVF